MNHDEFKFGRCLFKDKIAKGEILVQRIKAFVIPYGYYYTADGAEVYHRARNLEEIFDTMDSKEITEQCKGYLYEPIPETDDGHVVSENAESYRFMQKRERTVGYMVAALDSNGSIVIDLSFCKPDDYDNFKTLYGKVLACVNLYGRKTHALENVPTTTALTHLHVGEGYFYLMPYSLKQTAEYFANRAERYFKEHKLLRGSMVVEQTVQL